MFNKTVICAVTLLCGLCLHIQGKPFSLADLGSSFDLESKIENISEIVDAQNLTGPNDIYVVRAVRYEIAILTDADDSDSNETETSNRVDISFFGHSNGTHVDIEDVPLPVASPIDGQQFALLPHHIGAVDQQNVAGILENLPLTGAIVDIKSSNTGFVKLTETNATHTHSTVLTSHLPNAETINDVLENEDEEREKAHLS